MKKLKVYILEDEVHSLELLKSMLSEIAPEFELVGTASDLKTAKQDFLNLEFDLAFLDIQIRGKNVFTLLEELDSIRFHIVFTTAYSDYALQAIRMSAVDYLLKPYTIEDLDKAVNKILTKKHTAERLTALGKNLKRLQKLAIIDSIGLRFIELGDILYLHADRTYTDVYVKNGVKLTSSKTLTHYEEILEQLHFHRVHHSYIVNLNHIKSVNSKDLTLKLVNRMEIPISVRKKARFMKKLEELSFI